MNYDGYDHTPEGQQAIELLRRHAPAPPDVVAGARSVMLRLSSGRDIPGADGRLHFLAIAGPIAAALAAGVVIALFIMAPAPDVPTNNPGTDAGPLAAASQPAPEMRSCTVRTRDGSTVILDRGLTAGLRTNDVFTGAGGARVRISAMGIFFSQALVEAGSPQPGGRLECEATPAMLRAQSAAGGFDPGALYEFGAVLAEMPAPEARRLGFAGGRALAVREVITALLRMPTDNQAQATLAGRLGLQAGDVLLACNGYSIANVSDFTRALDSSRRVPVTLLVLRNGKEVELVTR